MAIPSIYHPPVYPDFYACSDFYRSLNKPDALDCQVALRMMLSGSDVRIWHIGRGLFGIPQIRTYGTCEIQLQASGPAAYLGQTFKFAPDAIHNMAGWVIDQCVYGAQMGGYVTGGIKNTTDYVATPETFYEDPFPYDTTFLNVVVWNSDRPFHPFNPGNMDPSTGTVIVREIARAYVTEPDESPLKPNIERNLDFFGQAVLAMRLTSFRTWWQGPPRESLTNSSTTNLTEFMNDLTLPANVTLPANFTNLALNSTSICADTSQGVEPGCGGQNSDLVSNS